MTELLITSGLTVLGLVVLMVLFFKPATGESLRERSWRRYKYGRLIGFTFMALAAQILAIILSHYFVQ